VFSTWETALLWVPFLIPANRTDPPVAFDYPLDGSFPFYCPPAYDFRMFTQAARDAHRLAQAIDRTGPLPISLEERLSYKRFMARDDVPVRCSPTLELEWVAFVMLLREGVDYEGAPSKVAASWLRKLRAKGSGVLRSKFWTDSWQYYIESRLGLELRSEAPRAAIRKRGAAVKTDESVRSSIEGMTKRTVVDAGS